MPDFDDRIYGGQIARSQKDMDFLFEMVTRRFAGRREVKIHRMTSAEAARRLPDRHFDWVYIDGDHSKEAVYRDLSLYLPKVKQGGQIAGDDYAKPEVMAGVKRFVAEHNAKAHEVGGGQFLLRIA